MVDGETVDDVLIDAEGIAIDGPGGDPRPGRADAAAARQLPAGDRRHVLRQRRPRDAWRRTAASCSVIIHEMGHVLGLGTIWDELGLRQGAGTSNPTFTGASAMRSSRRCAARPRSQAVPLANVGGPGTRDAHWREVVFGNELMTGFLNLGVNPLSRLTVGALQDMGYEVQLAAADPYALPTALEIAMMGIGGDSVDPHDRGIMLRPTPGVLPTDAFV